MHDVYLQLTGFYPDNFQTKFVMSFLSLHLGYLQLGGMNFLLKKVPKPKLIESGLESCANQQDRYFEMGAIMRGDAGTKYIGPKTEEQLLYSNWALLFSPESLSQQPIT